MKNGSGGTAMWCSDCKVIRTVRAIPGKDVTSRNRDYAQRRHHSEHKDLHFFQRGRECLSCGKKFLTAEIDLAYLFELAQLRDALKDLKHHAERYQDEASKAASSLAGLTSSLDVLRALQIYKET